MIWYVHRRGNAIASVHSEIQPGYAEEALAEQDSELQVWFKVARNPVPQTVTSGDFMRALIELGWYGDVKAVIDAQDPNTDQGLLIQVLWARAAVIERNNQILAMVAAAIGKTSEDLDALFLKTLTYF